MDLKCFTCVYGQVVHVCEPVLTRVRVSGIRTLGRGPPQCPGGLWVVGRGFGFWLCLSLCADITVLMAPNPSFYCTQHFLYKTPTHAHTHAASNANLAKKKSVGAGVHACMYGHTLQLMEHIWPSGGIFVTSTSHYYLIIRREK